MFAQDLCNAVAGQQPTETVEITGSHGVPHYLLAKSPRNGEPVHTLIG
jgi:hypothetical protein